MKCMPYGLFVNFMDLQMRVYEFASWGFLDVLSCKHTAIVILYIREYL